MFLKKSICMVVVALMLFSGCSTVNNRIDISRAEVDGKPDCKIRRVYGGVVFNLSMTNELAQSNVIYVPFMFVDLLLSLVADTVMLPVTIKESRSLRKMPHCKIRKGEFVEEE